MTDLNKHVEKLINMLQSPNPNTRYEACEYLRVAPAITPEAIAALQKALGDSSETVVKAAQSALAIHLTPEAVGVMPPRQNRPTGTFPIPSDLYRDVTPVPPTSPPMPSGSPNSPEYIFALEKRIMVLEEEFRRRSEALNQVITLSNNTFAKIPNSAIVSPNFLSRAFAVWGHYLVAQLLIAIPIYCIIFLIGIVSSR